jgi:hypothetical protein
VEGARAAEASGQAHAKHSLVAGYIEVRQSCRANWLAAARPIGSGCDAASDLERGRLAMIWHVIHEDSDGRVQFRAARSRDLAIHMACELLRESHEVRRVIGPNGSVI